VELGINEILKTLPHRYPFLLVDRIPRDRTEQAGGGHQERQFNEEFFRGTSETR
jgi:3-hydroxyacyl-[acyl-carrier-protein] dehydratase